MKITVLGAGAWGTALARLLQHGQSKVILWGHDAEGLQEICRTRRNERFLPGIELPEELRFETSLPLAIQGAEFIVVAVPSKGFRQVAGQLRDCEIPIVSVAKGIEHDTGLTMCGILAETVPKAKCAALSG